MTKILDWPVEYAKLSQQPLSPANWHHPGSNICLDFHGDPVNAGLVIFSDGNHHMALQESVQHFLQQQPDLNDIFYATTPPNVLLKCLVQGGMYMGNLYMSRRPDVFISPASILQSLKEKQFITEHHFFARSRGNVLLVRKGNPKQINSITDLARSDVTLFISNPEREKASYQVYRETILDLYEEQGLDKTAMLRKLETDSNTVFGERIHHREAPQAIYSGNADVAMVYYHLALRYCRIFPENFDFIPLGGTKENPQPSQSNSCTDYHIGIMSNAGNPAVARLFVDFLLGGTGAAIYESHGLKSLN